MKAVKRAVAKLQGDKTASFWRKMSCREVADPFAFPDRVFFGLDREIFAHPKLSRHVS